MKTPHTYAGGTLDRAAHLRRDADWIEDAWARADARCAAFWRGQALIAPSGEDIAALPAHRAPRGNFDWAWLGLDGGDRAPVFAIDLSAADEPHAQLPDGIGAFADLRAAAPRLPMHQAALLAYGRALLDWRRRARFCGMCGAATAAQQGGHVAVCTACAAPFFPRTDPTVIMLVTHGAGAEARALLGHNARFPGRKMYSTLAGFVEPGESLEEAVAREVMEEAGVRLGAVDYHSSQPWPYPANLMLGFTAEAVSMEITVDQDELLDARWFTRAELRDPDGHGFEVPPRFSIARRLIDEFIGDIPA